MFYGSKLKRSLIEGPDEDAVFPLRRRKRGLEIRSKGVLLTVFWTFLVVNKIDGQARPLSGETTPFR
jgi:hypothetical protein